MKKKRDFGKEADQLIEVRKSRPSPGADLKVPLMNRQQLIEYLRLEDELSFKPKKVRPPKVRYKR